MGILARTIQINLLNLESMRLMTKMKVIKFNTRMSMGNSLMVLNLS